MRVGWVLFYLFFRAHKEVLWFASPFFQAALSGNWAETGRPVSMSSVITISQPPTVPGDKIHPDAPTAMTFAPMDPDLDPDELDIDVSESSEPESLTSTVVVSGEEEKQANKPGVESGTRSEAEALKKAHEAARTESLEKLQGRAVRNAAAAAAESPKDQGKGKGKGVVKLSWKRGNAQTFARCHPSTSNPDAVIVLKEEKVQFVRRYAFANPISFASQASTFHDFLRFVYPRYAFRTSGRDAPY